MPRFSRISVRVGKPLTFDAVAASGTGARQRRAVTDEVMQSIQALSGQQYVPIYASVRKEQLGAAKGAREVVQRPR